ncbi:MAG: AmmeMemoRadiSam system radical SAM enzyme [Caldiserica bacterium]|jgi:pyruvate formate lyase activating enzyme|nr:AmmeMemoRadiSam system radical SAM enzyme [Caldisericota bacterium]MDH7561774.1 AmmeMemoRadiSam system radical SAM enzyme [Caldisericota bacterium]
MPEFVKAHLFESLEGGTARCLVCPRECVLKEGQIGFCGTRVNQGGEIYSMIYGMVSSVAIDPIEKKPLFHFHPGSPCLSFGSFGCNFRCIHCQNWSISHRLVEKGIPDGRYLSPQDGVKIALENQAKGISWTYNEPTIWHEYTMDMGKIAKEKGLYTVYVTNGFITPQALKELSQVLDAFRVDLKGWEKEFWRRICKIDDPAPVFRAAYEAKNKYHMHVEVVTNVIPTFNDDDQTFTNLARWILDNLGADCPWHITRFVPYLELSHLPYTPLSTLERGRSIGLETGLKFVYLGNVPGHPGENTFCPKCGTLLIERYGFWIKKNLLSSNNHCPKCGEKINIVGSIERQKNLFF